MGGGHVGGFNFGKGGAVRTDLERAVVVLAAAGEIDLLQLSLELGNEANGISDAVAACVSQRVTIPAFGDAESLNVGIACAVIVDNLKRLSSR